MQYDAVWCSVTQCVAMCCSVLQCQQLSPASHYEACVCVCMYVDVYLCTCMNTRRNTHTAQIYIRTQIYANMRKCLYNLYVYTYTYAYVYIHVHISVYIHMTVYIYVSVYIRKD